MDGPGLLPSCSWDLETTWGQARPCSTSAIHRCSSMPWPSEPLGLRATPWAGCSPAPSPVRLVGQHAPALQLAEPRGLARSPGSCQAADGCSGSWTRLAGEQRVTASQQPCPRGHAGRVGAALDPPGPSFLLTSCSPFWGWLWVPQDGQSEDPTPGLAEHHLTRWEGASDLLAGMEVALGTAC